MQIRCLRDHHEAEQRFANDLQRIVGETVLAGVLIASMARLNRVFVGGLARAGLVEVARQPVVWYPGTGWRIAEAE